MVYATLRHCSARYSDILDYVDTFCHFDCGDMRGKTYELAGVANTQIIFVQYHHTMKDLYVVFRVNIIKQVETNKWGGWTQQKGHDLRPFETLVRSGRQMGFADALHASTSANDIQQLLCTGLQLTDESWQLIKWIEDWRLGGTRTLKMAFETALRGASVRQEWLPDTWSWPDKYSVD
jgi:hypothetical protein